MNNGNFWVRALVTIFVAAIVLQLLLAAIRPLIPYLLAVVALGAVFAAVRWWRDRW
jgi:uncharacterized membrane protein YvlD (DUF360 family)